MRKLAGWWAVALAAELAVDVCPGSTGGELHCCVSPDEGRGNLVGIGVGSGVKDWNVAPPGVRPVGVRNDDAVVPAEVTDHAERWAQAI